MVASNWDAYWRNARSAAAHMDGGPQDEVLERFWLQLFEKVFPTFQVQARMLDIACGNGAIPRFALASSQKLVEGIDLQICGLDESLAALGEMRKRHAVLNGIAANALLSPFQDDAFDLMTSQFGMEYAGTDVFAEATRVLKPGGVIAAVLHMRGGGIYKECEINLQAIDGFRHCNLLPNFDALFREVLAAGQGPDSKEQLRQADKKFAASVAAAEDVLKRWGKDVANDTLFRVYTDIGHMYGRLRAYEPNEMFTWIDVINNELDSYSGRMSSMLGAALDQAEYEQVLAQLSDLGLGFRVQDILNFGLQRVPSAWVFIAEKPGP